MHHVPSPGTRARSPRNSWTSQTLWRVSGAGCGGSAQLCFYYWLLFSGYSRKNVPKRKIEFERFQTHGPVGLFREFRGRVARDLTVAKKNIYSLAIKNKWRTGSFGKIWSSKIWQKVLELKDQSDSFMNFGGGLRGIWSIMFLLLAYFEYLFYQTNRIIRSGSSVSGCCKNKCKSFIKRNIWNSRTSVTLS